MQGRRKGLSMIKRKSFHEQPSLCRGHAKVFQINVERPSSTCANQVLARVRINYKVEEKVRRDIKK